MHTCTHTHTHKHTHKYTHTWPNLEGVKDTRKLRQGWIVEVELLWHILNVNIGEGIAFSLA